MTKPRVLNVLPDLARGGGQVTVQRLLSVRAQRGSEPIAAYCYPNREMAEDYLQAGIQLVDLQYDGIHSTVHSTRRLLDTIRAHDINIIQTHGTRIDKYFGHVAALRTAVRHATTLHGNPPSTWARELGSVRVIARNLRDRLLFESDWLLARRTLHGVVAVSEAVLDAWRSILSRAVGERAVVEVIHSGVPMAQFGGASTRQVEVLRRQLLGEAFGREGAAMLLVASRLARGKNVTALVEVMQKLSASRPNAVLCVAGDGPQRGLIEARIRELKQESRIKLLGQRTDVPILMQAADLFVFPSENEGFGLVALEALAAGTPTVCYALPSLKELARDVPALRLVEPSVAALTHEVDQLLGDPEALKSHGHEGRELVARSWSVERTADCYEAFYDRVLKTAVNPRRRALVVNR